MSERPTAGLASPVQNPFLHAAAVVELEKRGDEMWLLLQIQGLVYGGSYDKSPIVLEVSIGAPDCCICGGLGLLEGRCRTARSTKNKQISEMTWLAAICNAPRPITKTGFLIILDGYTITIIKQNS